MILRIRYVKFEKTVPIELLLNYDDVICISECVMCKYFVLNIICSVLQRCLVGKPASSSGCLWREIAWEIGQWKC